MNASEVALIVDLNIMDDTGLPWAFLDEAPDPTIIHPGRHLVVGSGAARGSRLSSTSPTVSSTSGRCADR